MGLIVGSDAAISGHEMVCVNRGGKRQQFRLACPDMKKTGRLLSLVKKKIYIYQFHFPFFVTG